MKAASGAVRGRDPHAEKRTRSNQERVARQEKVEAVETTPPSEVASKELLEQRFAADLICH